MITEEGKDLVFSIKDSGDSIRLGQWKAGSSSYPINLEFGDGTALTTENLAMRQKMAGGGNPTVRGSNFSDRLYGDDRDNHIIGKSGNDIIDGGPGNDLLEGMEGDDTYQFTAGWGNDTIIENDMTSGNMDIVAFGSGLLPLDLMFNRSGDDLIVSQIGAANMITVSGWYLGATYQTEIFRASDGSVLLNSQVDRLIQDMAAFTQESGLDWVQAAQQMPEQTETILATAWNEANVMTG
jgi:Ca2+-binding RTX toxin-like protein